jgi:hypothetical protein
MGLQAPAVFVFRQSLTYARLQSDVIGGEVGVSLAAGSGPGPMD